MSDLALFLSNLNLGRQVVDKTGLNGKYDFTIRYTPDTNSGPNGADSGAPPVPTDAPSLTTALQEQLGIQLKLGTAIIDPVCCRSHRKALRELDFDCCPMRVDDSRLRSHLAGAISNDCWKSTAVIYTRRP